MGQGDEVPTLEDEKELSASTESEARRLILSELRELVDLGIWGMADSDRFIATLMEEDRPKWFWDGLRLGIDKLKEESGKLDPRREAH